ncbi:MAG: hypothetical protein JWR72_163 [Flavisolibacter sp.]|nr:hypothetical protein [Flavisolibacter sp.]
MNRSLMRMVVVFTALALLAGCKKKFDEYYERPVSLAPPIYQQLQTRGKFTQLLALINKAGYQQTLSNAGFWTLFAPNDEAFTTFFRDRGITGIEKIDSSTARAIVQYMLVYNSFDKVTLDDYQSSTGWLPDQAFRRRTAYYTGFYDDTMQNGQVVKATQSNRNGTGNPYVSSDNNNKYIPYFTDIYFAAKGLTAADYTYFYPSSQFSGFNVGEAKVVTRDIAAENGIVHEIDKVITPLPSIDEYLRSKPEYSEFKRLYDRYLVGFVLNADATNRYKLVSGDNKQVYVKTYSSGLAFSLNNENYVKLQDNDGQQNSWTIFAPKNDVLLAYEKNVLLEYYGSFDNTPTAILLDFLNAHMWQSPVWPSKFNSTTNFVGEEARFNPQTDVVDRKILSNAIFYGTSKVQEANVFSSVYSRAYLDPKFSIMTRLLNTDLRFIITHLGSRFTMFMMPDAVLRAAGYDFNTASNLYTCTTCGSASSETIRQNLLRILNTSVIPGDLPDLSGSGITEAYNGEFIKWNNNQVISIGTQDAAQVVRIDSTRTTANGKVYYLNGLLSFSTVNIGTHIKNLGGTSTASDFNYFANYLVGSNVYTAATGEITGTVAGSLYTVFVPSNAAIMQAVKDGVLPGSVATGIPNLTASTWTPTQREDVNRFILYHILNKRTLIPNGNINGSGSFETMLKNTVGEVLPITVINLPGSIQITDMNNRRANVVVPKSNNLSNRAVIHLIDNYLKYTF